MALDTAVDALGDVEYLVRSEYRVAALEAITERPRTRADLRAATGASASTVSRLLRAFERREWVRRDGSRYEVTQLGAFVAAGVRGLVDRIETERGLRGVRRSLPDEASGFSLEMAADSVVTVAEAGAPYGPVNRFVELLDATDRFRFVGADVALLEPCRHDLRRRIVDGMRAEIVDPPDLARYVLSTYREHCRGPLESGNLAVWTHDDLPAYGVGLFDERIAVSCYDQESGVVRALIDTDDARAREWAESTFDSYRREAEPLRIEPTLG